MPVLRLIGDHPDCDVNAGGHNSYSTTPLIHASKVGDAGIVSYLLTVPGADVNVQTALFRTTALIEATLLSHTGVVRTLLASSGVDPNLARRNGDTPLHAAAFFRSHRPVVDLLLNAEGIDPRRRNAWNLTALDYARKRGYTYMVDRLKTYFGGAWDSSNGSE